MGVGRVTAWRRGQGNSSERAWPDALRRWWIVPLAAALVGNVAGLVATSGGQPFATATLALQIDGVDAQTVSRQSQAALAQVTKSDVFDRAGKAMNMPVADVRAATDLAASSDGLGINVRARAAEPEQAVSIANAVATAAVAAAQAETQAQLKDLEAATTALINTPAISDVAAERARVTRLGEGLADNQSRVVAQSNRIRLLQPAEVATVQVPSSRNTALLGLIGGLLIGILGVIQFGTRRGRVRREAELGGLYADAPRTTPDGIKDVATPDGRPALHVVVVEELARGTDREVSEAVGQAAADAPGDVEVLATRLGSTTYRRALRDPETAVLLPVVLGRTRIQDLDRAVRAGHRDPSFLVLDRKAAAPARPRGASQVDGA